MAVSLVLSELLFPDQAFTVAIGVAVKAGIAVVLVAAYLIVFIVHLGLIVLMTINAAEHGIVRWIGMAVSAGIPFTVVFAGIYRKILNIMIKGRWRPAVFCMAVLTGDRKLCRQMWRVAGLIVGIYMAIRTGIGG